MSVKNGISADELEQLKVKWRIGLLASSIKAGRRFASLLKQF